MRRIIWLVIVVLIVTSCGKKAKYDRLVQQELASGVRYDSLFLGIHLGMTSEAFYKHCWDLNKQGLIRQGTGNLSVLYNLEYLKYPADMNFYPSFHEDKIYEMPVRFKYNGWSPWNRHLFSDSLQLDVLNLFKEWYGNDFIEINHTTRGKAFVKVKGNRRISIFTKGEIEVHAVFTDMSLAEQVKKENEMKGKDEATTD